jgi:serine/threonine-protein kinase Chk2
MIEVDPGRRITVDEALRHPWITQATFHPGDSCGSLTHAIENLGFVRRKVKQERTLLADAPDLLNTSLQNGRNAHGTTNQRNNDNDNDNDKSKGKQEVEKNGGSEAAGKGAEELDANTKVFVHVGGKGVDETLYGDSSFESAK